MFAFPAAPFQDMFDIGLSFTKSLFDLGERTHAIRKRQRHCFWFDTFGLDVVAPGMRPALCLGDAGFVSGIAVIGPISIGEQGTFKPLELRVDMGAAP